MKKVFWIIVVLAVVCICIDHCTNDDAKDKQTQTSVQKTKHKTGAKKSTKPKSINFEDVEFQDEEVIETSSTNDDLFDGVDFDDEEVTE